MRARFSLVGDVARAIMSEERRCRHEEGCCRRRGDVVTKKDVAGEGEITSEERRCCRRRGDHVRGEEMLQEKGRSRQRRGDVAGGEEITSEEMLQEKGRSRQRRCCRRRGDHVRGEEMLQEERRSRQRRGDVAGGEEITSEERRCSHEEGEEATMSRKSIPAREHSTIVTYASSALFEDTPTREGDVENSRRLLDAETIN
jgi:hypothetical protein